MTILTDAAGNRYVGKAEKREDRNGITSDTYFMAWKSDMYTALGQQSVLNRSEYLLSVTTFNTNTNIDWRAGTGDTRNNRRYTLKAANTSNSASLIYVDSTNVDRGITENSSVVQSLEYITGYTTISPSGASLGMLRQEEKPDGTYSSIFLYAGKLLNVNPHPRYANYADTIVGITAGDDSFATVNSSLMQGFYHRAGSLQQYTQIYKAGDAQYNITCLNGEAVQPLHVTDWIVFENDPAEDYPYMGRVQNLLLGYGTFDKQSVYEVNPASSGVAIDGGSNFYIPVGRFGDRTILMRIGDPN